MPPTPPDQETARTPEETPVHPLTQAKLDNEAWLQGHSRVVLPLVALLILGVFVLPWFFFDFLTVLGIQVMTAAVLYYLGKRFTTVFDHRRPF